MSKKIPIFVKGTNGKSCEGCTKCCDGYLTAIVNGQEIGNGVACQSVISGKGCSIYKTRPEDPCRTFMCFWRASEIMPMEFKPSETGVIVTAAEIEGIYYLRLCEAGNMVHPEVLTWFLQWVFMNQLNAEWQVGNKFHSMGSNEFHAALARRAVAEGRGIEKPIE